jgi:hypothetical protein
MEEVSSARLRDELYWADKMIDRRGDRQEAVDRSNRIREKFNVYAYDSGKAETVFEIPPEKKGYCIPLAEVKVLPFDDGKYSYAVHANITNMGFGFGFSDSCFADRQTAIRTGIGIVLEWALRSAENANSTTKRQLQVIIRTAKERLAPPRQSTLS